MSDHVQTRSFAELLASKLAEQNIHLDTAELPADVSAADAWLGGDGTHLAGTALQPYVDAWGWETLKPLLEYAIGAVDAELAGSHYAAGDAGSADSQYAASDADVQASWVYELLVAAGLDDRGLDPYGAPDAVHVAQLVRDGVTNPDIWPELSRLLDDLGDDEANEVREKLRIALDQVGDPPPSQW